MFGKNGAVLKEVVVERCGHTDFEFFCWYTYKEEHEPEANKIKYPNKEDRWYEDYMYLSTINEAQKSGAAVDINKYMSNRLEWNEEHQKFAIRKEKFHNEEDYYKQFR